MTSQNTCLRMLTTARWWFCFIRLFGGWIVFVPFQTCGWDPTKYHVVAANLKLIVVFTGALWWKLKIRKWTLRVKKVSDDCQQHQESNVVIPPYLYFSRTYAGVKCEWCTCLGEPLFARWPLPSLDVFHSTCFWGSWEAVTSESTSSAAFNKQSVSTSTHLNQTNSMIKRHT